MCRFELYLGKTENNSSITRKKHNLIVLDLFHTFILLAWCREKQIQTPLEQMTLGQLDANLRRFYPEARKTTGEMYSKKTLLGFRHAIERYMNQPPFNSGLKLSSDPRFNRSNQMLDAQLVQMKRQNKDDTNHKPVIESQDLQKLKTSKALSPDNPWSLLRNVWFHLILFFCRRGREGQRELKTSSLKFEVDASGRHYATMAHDEATKNHPGGIKDVNSSEKKSRMYETDESNDGYKALRLYLSKTNPKCESLFQYPKRNWAPTDDVWYENRPVGINKLDSMMREISKEAGLSRIYTNHSVRATSITLMSNAGIPNRHIMAISGHRNEQSLAHYNTRPSTEQLHHCSEVLSQNLSSSRQAIVPASVHLTTAVNNNNLVVEARQDPTFSSIFNDCSIQNVQLIMHKN